MNKAVIVRSVAAFALGAAMTIALPASAEEAIDTVFLTNGGRVRGAVMVDDAKVVSVKLADGKTKEIARTEVVRVEYAATAAAAAEVPTASRVTRKAARAAVAEDAALGADKARRGRGRRAVLGPLRAVPMALHADLLDPERAAQRELGEPGP